MSNILEARKCIREGGKAEKDGYLHWIDFNLSGDAVLKGIKEADGSISFKSLSFLTFDDIDSNDWILHPKEKEELKPCLYCQHNKIEIYEGDNACYFYTSCPKCDAEGPLCDSRHEITRIHNSRYIDRKKIKELLEKLENLKKTSFVPIHLYVYIDKLKILLGITDEK